VIRKILGTLLGAVILLWFLLGVLVIVFMPFELWRMADAQTWPFREGVITKSVASPQGSARRTLWTPAIRVAYRDTGEEVWITRVRYGEFRLRGAERASAEADVARYRPGAVVRVYYSPANPKETLLEPFAPWTTMIVISSIGATGVLVPVVLFLFRKRGG
jgi:hypothetical protein